MLKLEAEQYSLKYNPLLSPSLKDMLTKQTNKPLETMEHFK